MVDSVVQIENLHHDSSPALIPLLQKLSISTSNDEPQYAVVLMQRALDIAERQRGPESREVADVLTDFGFLFAPRHLPGVDKNPIEDVEKAEAHLRRSIEIYLSLESPTESGGLTNSLGQMRALLEGQGRLDEAAAFGRLYSDALAEEDRLKAETKHRDDKAGH